MEDPGWRYALRQVWPIWLRILSPSVRRRARSLPFLLVLRSLFVIVVGALIAIAGALWIISPERDSTGVGWFPFLILISSLLGSLRMATADRRIGRAEDANGAAAQYRAVSFIKIGVWEATPLLGFVGAFIAGREWPYLEGLGLALLALPLAAPTKRSIERAQARLDENGVEVGLLALLLRPASA